MDSLYVPEYILASWLLKKIFIKSNGSSVWRASIRVQVAQKQGVTAEGQSSKALCVPLAAAVLKCSWSTSWARCCPGQGLCCLSRPVSVPGFTVCAGCCFKAFNSSLPNQGWHQLCHLACILKPTAPSPSAISAEERPAEKGLVSVMSWLQELGDPVQSITERCFLQLLGRGRGCALLGVLELQGFVVSMCKALVHEAANFPVWGWVSSLWNTTGLVWGSWELQG